ncbi:MAG: UDP-N-acetylglucosamine--N-acetylmuramyl-(pentapeptide) pyrophosphoryl-undecaprenol N-acetylglucosamine transferase [bacterium]|nr:UDP-N-acetylglucosamine--N-acetylmuramyl-(pentapeptide) pyrophosphoryl-undecaprenol N-acetylglucosamine transferase [bacterium]
MKILITGGHYTPAMAVIDHLKNHEIVFVGRKYSIESEQTESPEFKEINLKGIRFIPLQTGKINRFISLGMFLNLLRIFIGLKQAKKIVTNENPDVILCFGSYLAVPIAIHGWLNKVPVFTHEQTINPGLSNRVISLFSKKVFISFDKSKRFFPKKKILLTGNPIRKSIENIINKTKYDSKIKTIFILGGSLGSHSINEIMLKNLKKLLEKYIIIHQTGNVKEFDDYRKSLIFKRNLPLRLKKNYQISQHFNDSQIGVIYEKADMLISRAGANTVFELIALKKPSILIPLPWSANKEQEKQAKFLKENGVCEIFYQNQNPEKIKDFTDKVINNLSLYKNNFKNINYLYKKNAAQTIAKEILQK